MPNRAQRRHPAKFDAEAAWEAAADAVSHMAKAASLIERENRELRLRVRDLRAEVERLRGGA